MYLLLPGLGLLLMVGALIDIIRAESWRSGTSTNRSGSSS
ncbi:hypothetical protein RCH11_000722 [Glaciihabitans sp. GrIS 2.15]|nr:hypothetical protein [Glaciihabitans sp. GrIS 2.15]